MTTVIGLTGGIATGKSTVAKMLAEAGAVIIDADQVAHAIVEPKTPTLAKLATVFGDTIMDENGALDRHALGPIVFQDKTQLERLNKIMQPVIRTTIMQQIMAAKAQQSELVVLDAPLLFEQHYENDVDLIVVVSVSAKMQLQRLMHRDQLTKVAAKRRIKSQLSLAKKRQQADIVIDNGGSVEATRLQVVKLLEKVRQQADAGNI
ncbi:dephospho-CoA kinase [Furfurilactobacillus siliginis]|uniref:Dephospho-CoA kinase n=1 Tax=Furfurilactobacillus siliginis TaxID=348151 RepID=A0A0R2L4S9_9LACO|nr:dephospho-CoA kinase [Furfurilactobacillus siliginis]KRN94524.1 dephospho-CoA kinase [Furfurilactobacillus siliginis]GEK28565.1 dephospho-CoA kinase [Furfurilactobacillus siliginis]